MLEELELDSEERIKAFTHPYRMRLLNALRQHARPATATELARSLGDGPGKAHYHMRLLEAAGIVSVVRTELVNGIIARYYEPAARHFVVQPGLGSADEDGTLRDELSRMIARRFKAGLKAFLERTMMEAGDEAEGAERGVRPGQAASVRRAFLYDQLVHCDDEAWQELRSYLDEFAAKYAAAGQGRRARRLFIAGASDLPPANDRALAGGRGDASLGEPAPVPAYWTLGMGIPGSSGRWQPPEPPLR